MLWSGRQQLKRMHCSLLSVSFCYNILHKLADQLTCTLLFKRYTIPVFKIWNASLHTLLTPNVNYRGRTAPLTSKVPFLYIYSTNIGTEYFKHGIYSPFFSLQNAVCFIILTYLVPVWFTFYIQGVLKLKKEFRHQKDTHDPSGFILLSSYGLTSYWYYNIYNLIIVQQDANYSVYYIFVGSSTCFGC